MIWQTKEYMTDKLVKPVLKRADSVVEIGNAVLASKYTTIAAHTLDSALNVADKYVDKYLPDAADQAFEGIILYSSLNFVFVLWRLVKSSVRFRLQFLSFQKRYFSARTRTIRAKRKYHNLSDLRCHSTSFNFYGG